MQTGSVSAAEGKALSMLGMSLKAGRLALGESAARKALLSGKAELVIFASDCADNTRKKLELLCEKQNTPIIIFSVKENLGKALGKDGKAVLALTDKGFAEAIKKIIS